MPDGGSLTIKTMNTLLDARVARERDMLPGDYVVICVIDTGTGMSPEVMAKAFDPFFTTKPVGVGTGLGLSMTLGFAKQSGGQVQIHSTPGKGTTLCFYLPRYWGTLDEKPDQDRTIAPSRAGAGETVLIVDDEASIRMLVTETLGDLGYIALEAEDGVLGLQLLQSPARIDLLITDVGLPGGLNDRQMADAARAIRPDLKVLFITGYAEGAVVSHGELNENVQVLTKPFALNDLAERIQQMMRLNDRGGLNEETLVP